MNILEIIIIIATAWLGIAGFRKGFVRKLASMLSLVLSIILVSVFLPYITDFLKESTPVYEYITEQCEKAVAKQAVELLTGEASGGAENYLDMLGGLQLGKIEQTEVIENLPVPQTFKDMLLDYNNSEGYNSLNVSTFQGYIVTFISNVVLTVVSYIVAILVVQILLWVAITALNIVANIPVIRVINRLAGFGLGLLEALFLIWIFFMILSMFSATDVGLYLMSMVQESEFLGELYDSNLFLAVVLRATAIFS